MTLDRMFAYDWYVKDALKKMNTRAEYLKLEISNLEREMENTKNTRYKFQLQNRIRLKKMDLDRLEGKIRRGDAF